MTHFPIARYRFTVVLKQPMRLPDYAGSMLRGGFGHALRKVSCLTRQKNCDGCSLRSSCAYSQVFEPQSPSGHSWHQQKFPVPYVIEPPAWGRKVLQAGERLQFSMVLIGPALEQLSFVLLAWQQAWQQGFGPHRVTGTLSCVEWQQESRWQTVFSSDEAVIRSHQPRLTLPELPFGKAHLHFVTPLRLQQKGKPLGPDKLQRKHFLNGLVRRIDLISQCYWPEKALDGRSLSPCWEAVADRRDLGWLDWSRYSNRQQQKMALGGVVGHWFFSGNLQPFITYLQLGQWLHVGKNASFGLGAYQLQLQEVSYG